MSSELAAWLRRQREDRGWTRTELARQLIRAARARGDTSLPGTDNISHNIYRWERGAVTPAERYKLLYCSAFGIPFSQFGTALPPGMVDAGPAVPAASAYGGTPPERGGSAIRREVLMAAHEGSAHAEGVEQRGIGEATLEQFRADAASLAVQYLTGETFGLFTEMRRVRNRITEALGRRQWPRDAAELYLLAGCLSALMAAAAVNLGYPQAASELTRAGWAYATGIDHRPLMARLRLCAAYAAYWSGHPQECADLARSGLGFIADGQGAAQLHLLGGLPAAVTPPARARPSRPPATPGTASTTTSCSRSAASSAFPGRPSPTTRASSWPRRARSRPPPPNWRLPPACTRPARARASSTAAGAGCSRTPTWPSPGCGRVRWTPRSRPWSPCWPCRRASARRSRASGCPCSGPDCPSRPISARPGPAAWTSSWPRSAPRNSDVCLLRTAERHGTPDPVRSNAVKARFQCVRQRTDRHDQHKLNGISLQQHGAPFMMYGSGTGVARVTKARFRYRPARSMAQMKDPVLAFRQNTSETSFNATEASSSAIEAGTAEHGGHGGLHDRERALVTVGERLAAADDQGAARPHYLAGDREPLPGRGREQVDRVARGQHGGVRRHHAERRKPARGVEHRGHRAGVQEPVLLGEPVVMRQRHLDLARLDRGHLDAERAHHLLAVEAGPHPGQHRLVGFRHPPIVSPGIPGDAVRLPGRAGGPPPEPRHAGGHPAELLVGPPPLGRAHGPLRVVLPAHVVHHHRHHVLTSSPVWPVIKTTNGNPPDGRATRPARTFPRKPA